MEATQNASLSPLTSPRPQRTGPSMSRRRAGSRLPHHDSHEAALHAIRVYLKGRTAYDAFPVSFRVIALDTKLEVKKALECLLTSLAGHPPVVSAPLWNSEQCRFAGMFTVSDIIHLIQHYYHTATYEAAVADVENVRLEALRDIEKSLGVATPPLIREHPSASLFDAAKRLIQTHARRLPLLDNDTETGHEIIVSVLTQYRLLKFIAINCAQEVSHLYMSLRKLGIGTYVAASPTLPTQAPVDGEKPKDQNPYSPISTATLTTPVFDVVHMFSERGISAVPIVDENGIVVNMYETVDVITLVKSGAYQSLDLTIAEALNKRSADFPGVVICNSSDSLGFLIQLIKQRRVHRLVVVEGDAEEKLGGRKGRLLGIITLSDVLRYLVGEVGIGETPESGELADTTHDF